MCEETKEKHLLGIKDDILIKFHENNWEQNSFIYYNIGSHNFREFLNINMTLKITIAKLTLSIQMEGYRSYTCNTWIEKSVNLINDVDDGFDDIEQKVIGILDFIYNFRFEYKYSKLLDKILPKNNIVEKENIHTSLMFINHKEIENCSVCMEENKVLTPCCHNLCRECFYKISKKTDHPLCPLCRECITCYNEDENENVDH